MNFRSLLVGIPRYEDDRIDDLPACSNDILLMESCLKEAGYWVETNGLDGSSPEVKRTEILVKLSNFFTSLNDNDVGLVYLSSHGVNIDGTNYIVPADGSLANPDIAEEILLEVNFDRLFENSKSQFVLVLIDACREGAEIRWGGEKKSLGVHRWGEARIKDINKRQICYIFSCGPGEYSYFTKSETPESVFARALASTIKSRVENSFSEFVTRMPSLLRFESENAGRPVQSIRIKGEFDPQIFKRTQLLFSEKPTGINPQSPIVDFLRLSTDSPVWQQCDCTNIEQLEDFKAEAKEISGIALQWIEGHSEKSSSWSTDNFILRFLSHFEFLIVKCGAKISALEFYTTIVSVVYWYCLVEYLLVCINSPQQKADEAMSSFNASRTEFASWFESYKVKIELAASRIDEAEVDALSELLKLIWINEKISTVNQSEICGFIQQCNKDNREGLPFYEFVGSQVFSACVNSVCGVEFSHSYGNADVDKMDAYYMSGTIDEQSLRSGSLCVIIRIATSMAVHIGMLDVEACEALYTNGPIGQQEFLSFIDGLKWEPKLNERNLVGMCPHPSLDSSVRNYVTQLDEFYKTTRSKEVGETNELLHQVFSVGEGFRYDGLQPVTVGGLNAYTTPHVRIRLEESKVRSLLMGDQLYGDPTVAVREMYQNAVDACRYRSARHEYQARSGGEIDSDWQPKIELSTFQLDGQTVFQCADNGIGMSRQLLGGYFAFAGARYSESQEYLKEMEDWRKLSPPIELSMNSVFGIGSLSYFMLGKEISVYSRRLLRSGKFSEGIRAGIDISSSTIRVQQYDGLLSGGTVVQIHLASKFVTELSEEDLLRALMEAQGVD